MPETISTTWPTPSWRPGWTSWRPDLHGWYADFTDELAYLRLRPGFASVTTLSDLAGLPPALLAEESITLRGLVRDSMVHKLARLVVHSR